MVLHTHTDGPNTDTCSLSSTHKSNIKIHRSQIVAYVFLYKTSLLHIFVWLCCARSAHSFEIVGKAKSISSICFCRAAGLFCVSLKKRWMLRISRLWGASCKRKKTTKRCNKYKNLKSKKKQPVRVDQIELGEVVVAKQLDATPYVLAVESNIHLSGGWGVIIIIINTIYYSYM